MKTTKNERLINFYCMIYFVKYLRCIVVQSQMEKEAIQNITLNKCLNSQKLLKLNLKHNRLAKSLYDQRLKLEKCA